MPPKKRLKCTIFKHNDRNTVQAFDKLYDSICFPWFLHKHFIFHVFLMYSSDLPWRTFCTGDNKSMVFVSPSDVVVNGAGNASQDYMYFN